MGLIKLTTLYYLISMSNGQFEAVVDCYEREKAVPLCDIRVKVRREIKWSLLKGSYIEAIIPEKCGDFKYVLDRRDGNDSLLPEITCSDSAGEPRWLVKPKFRGEE